MQPLDALLSDYRTDARALVTTAVTGSQKLLIRIVKSFASIVAAHSLTTRTMRFCSRTAALGKVVGILRMSAPGRMAPVGPGS
jgi:hypothetical protein